MNLVNLAAKGIGWNTLGTFLRSILGLVQLGLLSRYLSAAELGTYSQLFVITNIGILLVEFGLTAASISQGQLSKEQQRQLGFCYLGLGIVNALAAAALAPGMVWLMDNPQLGTVLPVFAPIFVVVACGQFAMMQSQKAMQFKTIVIAETLAAAVSTALVAVGVWQDWGIWAFVVGMAGGHLIRTLHLVIKFEAPSFALWQMRWSQCTRYLHYGWQFTAGNLVSMLVTSMDIILISRLLGVEQTGQYGIIKDLVFRISRMVRPILTRVALPFYANLRGNPHLGRVYCYAGELLGYIVAPIYLFFAVFPEPSITLLLGQKWLHLSPLLQILAVWMVVRLIMSQSGVLLSSVGRVRESLVWNLWIAAIYPVAIVIGAQFGVVVVALAALGMQLLLFWPQWWMLLRPLKVPAGLYLKTFILPVVMSLTALIIPWVSEGWLTQNYPFAVVYLILLAAPVYAPMVLLRLKRTMTLLKWYSEPEKGES